MLRPNACATHMHTTLLLPNAGATCICTLSCSSQMLVPHAYYAAPLECLCHTHAFYAASPQCLSHMHMHTTLLLPNACATHMHSTLLLPNACPTYICTLRCSSQMLFPHAYAHYAAPPQCLSHMHMHTTLLRPNAGATHMPSTLLLPNACATSIGLAITVFIHRTWLYIRWFPCQKLRIHTVYIWSWPTLHMRSMHTPESVFKSPLTLANFIAVSILTYYLPITCLLPICRMLTRFCPSSSWRPVNFKTFT